MRIERFVWVFLALGLGAGAAIFWQRTEALRQENAALREQLAAKDTQIANADASAGSAKKQEETLRAQTSELVRLRGEVTQLRNSAKDSTTLKTELEHLRAENQQLRSGSNIAPAAQTKPSLAGKNEFPRESWNFAGFESPEAALVSAIWSMKEGNPTSYLDSLSPAEQERMAKEWENKNEQEIAAKHQKDVSPITGMKIIDRQTTSADEVIMDVHIEGVDRTEKVRMNRIGQDWKFGGFIREQQQQPPPQPAPQ